MKPPAPPKPKIENGKKRPLLCPQFFLLAAFFALLSYPLPAIAMLKTEWAAAAGTGYEPPDGLETN